MNQIHMVYKKLQCTIIPNEDFQDGWYWAYLPNEEETGPEYRPFIGKQQLLLDPCIKDPEYFFHEMFSPTMFDAIAESTNRYATQRIQRRGRSFFISFIFYPEQRDHKVLHETKI